MMRRIIVGTAVLIGIALAGAPALAQPGYGGGQQTDANRGSYGGGNSQGSYGKRPGAKAPMAKTEARTTRLRTVSKRAKATTPRDRMASRPTPRRAGLAAGLKTITNPDAATTGSGAADGTGRAKARPIIAAITIAAIRTTGPAADPTIAAAMASATTTIRGITIRCGATDWLSRPATQPESSRLARRKGDDRQRMDRPRQFLAQRGIDRTLSQHPTLALEGRRFNHHIEMGFALGPGAGVAVMTAGLIDHLKADRLETGLKLAADRLNYGAHQWWPLISACQFLKAKPSIAYFVP